MQIIWLFYFFAAIVLAVFAVGAVSIVIGGGLAFCRRCRAASIAFLVVGMVLIGGTYWAVAAEPIDNWEILRAEKCSTPKSWSDGQWCEEAAKCQPGTRPKMDLVYGAGWRLIWCEPLPESTTKANPS